ncbi:unnamed protein product, partial [Prorocentrum cordatum]
ERDAPQVWIDYSFPGMKGTGDAMTLLVCLDFESSAIESASVMEKGTVEYGIKVLVQALQYWGRKRMVVSSGQENAITAPARAAAAARDEETVLQVGPRFDSKSKGPIEAAGGKVQQLIRTLVYTVNARYKVELKPSEPISSCLARHAGWILTRLTVRGDGLTPHRRLEGRDYHGQIAEFAETAMHKLPPGAAGKINARWDKGIWLGKANVSDEHMIGTPRGRVFARSIARRPGEKRWNKNLFSQIICTPFDPKATLLARGAMNRPRYLTKGVLNRLGRTPGCPACDETGQHRTAECRARLEALLDAEDIAKGLAAQAGARAEAPPPAREAVRKQSKRAPAEEPGRGAAAAAAAAAVAAPSVAEDVAMDHEEESVEMMVQDPAEITEGVKRQVSEKEEMPEGKKARVVGGLAANIMPIELCAVDLGEYAAEPCEEKDLSNVEGAKGMLARGKWLQDWMVGTDTVRCRFVAMKVAYQARDDAFAGAPSLKFVRLALVLAATFRNLMKVYLIGLWDISNAFFHAEMDEDACVVPPSGEEEPNVVWQLRKALYGTRRASKLFQHKVIGTLIDQGFIRMLVTEIVFYHVQKGIYIVVHGDDFMAVGAVEDLRWPSEILEAKYEVKRSPFVGPAAGGGEATSGHFLKRTVRWTEKGFHWESDAKHARTAVEACGKLPAAREISPASKSMGKEVPTALDKLRHAEGKLFQPAAPTALYLAADRPDIQFATSWIMRGMQEPLVLDELELKRLAAYLVTIVTDSDWAGDEEARMSRGGGFEYIGSACIDSWAGQQATRALSSGEAEYVEMTNCAARGIFTKNLFEEMGIQMAVKVCEDITAAIGICSRLGVGRIRHLDVKYLWLQEKVAEKEVPTVKVPTAENVADLMTK